MLSYHPSRSFVRLKSPMHFLMGHRLMPFRPTMSYIMMNRWITDMFPQDRWRHLSRIGRISVDPISPTPNISLPEPSEVVRCLHSLTTGSYCLQTSCFRQGPNQLSDPPCSTCRTCEGRQCWQRDRAHFRRARYRHRRAHACGRGRSRYEDQLRWLHESCVSREYQLGRCNP